MLLFLKNILWSPVTIILIAVTGTTLSFKTHHRALKHPIKKLKETLLSHEDNHSAFEATFTALGGTIGVGNTIGVAGAIKDGGAGAVFWMIIASLFGMVIKESEIYLAIKHKRAGNLFSGPMYYIEDKIGIRFFAKLWAVSCVMTAIGMGNMSQTMAASNSLTTTFGTPKIIISSIVSIIVIVTILSGITFIKKHISVAVAFISIVFVFSLIYISFKQRNNIPQTLELIVKDVLSFSKAVKGTKWAVFASSVRTGFSRGIFTNEAGLGSASILHSTSNENTPEKQSAWGVIEVFIDTVLICTLTSLIILTSERNVLSLPTEEVTFSIFEATLGRFGAVFYSVSTLLFALASVSAWYCYAECALTYLGASKKQILIFKIFFTIASFIGGIAESNKVLLFSDIFNGIMLIINITAMLLISNDAKSD